MIKTMNASGASVCKVGSRDTICGSWKKSLPLRAVLDIVESSNCNDKYQAVERFDLVRHIIERGYVEIIPDIKSIRLPGNQCVKENPTVVHLVEPVMDDDDWDWSDEEV